MLDKSFQDLQFGADFRCAAGCKTGVLFRAEKTADGGMKGIYVSLTPGETGSFAVTLDANGKELTRESLSTAGGMARFSAPMTGAAAAAGGNAGRGAAPAAAPGGGAPAGAPAAAPGGGGRGGRAGGGAPGGAPGAAAGAPGGAAPAAPAPGRGGLLPAVQASIPRQDITNKAGEWNDLDVVIDTTLFRPWINTSPATAGGSVAIYGGDGQVRSGGALCGRHGRGELPRRLLQGRQPQAIREGRGLGELPEAAIDALPVRVVAGGGGHRSRRRPRHLHRSVRVPRPRLRHGARNLRRGDAESLRRISRPS